jgi:hypothetical protein
MADTASDLAERRPAPDVNASMPLSVKCAVFGVVSLLLAGAVALLALRGDALLLDLSALAGRVFCL